MGGGRGLWCAISILYCRFFEGFLMFLNKRGLSGRAVSAVFFFSFFFFVGFWTLNKKSVSSLAVLQRSSGPTHLLRASLSLSRNAGGAGGNPSNGLEALL